jgi:hypothetical protein
MKKIFLAAFALLAVVPAHAYAASSSFFGPIVSEQCRCPGAAPTYGCVLDTVQRMINFGITIGIVAFTFALAYAGFVWMTSGGNPEARSKGRGMLINVFVGLFIVLTAWLLVDFVMKQLYAGDNGSKDFGPWNSILADAGTSMCIEATKPSAIAGTGIGGAIARGLTTEMGGTGNQLKPTPSGGGTTAPSGGTGANCPAANPSSMEAFAASVTSGDAEKATPSTVRNFLAMRTAALKDGVDLKVTDAYRPESEQLALWKQYCSSGTCGATKVAKPCSLGGNGSNHNSGEALDLTVGCSNGQSSCNTKAYQWLKTHGAQYNFRNSVPTDPVHWSPSGN